MTRSRSPLFLALLPLLAATPALAQNAAPPATQKVTELPSVQVKGHPQPAKQATAINSWGTAAARDVPATVQVIDRRQIDQRQIRTLSELAREDAALGDNYAPVGYYQNLTIRGYAQDLGTGYKLNGLALTGEQRIALEDKQQVEVLKGLAGISAGVMEPGGVVNFISKRPADVRNLTLGSDEQGSRYASLDIGSWLTPQFGLRANLAWGDAQSYINHADGHRTLMALAADWAPSEATTLQFDINHQHSAQRSASGYMLLGGTTLPAHPNPTSMLGYQPWQQPVGIVSTNLSARLLHRFSAHWQARIEVARSRSVIDDNVAFAYGCYYTAACASGATPGNFFAPNGDYDIYDYRSPDDTRVGDSARAVLEGQLDSGRIRHQLTLGVSAFHRHITRRPYVYDYVGSANINDPTPPVYAPSPNQPGLPVLRFDSWQRSLFALDRMEIGEQWQFLLGGNVVRMHERAWKSSGRLVRTTRLNQWLPQAAVLWQPNALLTTYLSYSEGLSLGKEAPFWTSNDGEFLAPRHSRQLETGIKYRWNDRFDTAASVFRIHQPYQFAQPDSSSAGYTFVQRGQEVHTGLELSGSGQLSDRLHASASLAWIHARTEQTGTPAYEGHQVANVPALRTSVHLDYTLPIQPQVSVQGGWRHASENPATPTGLTRADAYDVFDAGLRWQTHWQRTPITVQLSIDNLFNRSYWRDVGSSDGDSYLFPGAPRQARLSVRMAL